jgi:hypothetical protein
VRPVAAQIAVPVKMGLEPVQRFEQCPHRRLVAVLRGGETGAVDAVVDRRIDELVPAVYFTPQLYGIHVGSGFVAYASNSRFSIRMISEDSLLTIVRRSRSHSVGTVTLPVYSARALV